MKSFKAHELVSTLRELHNEARLVFESKRGPEYRLHAVDGLRNILRKCKELCEKLELRMSALHASQLIEATEGPAREQLDSGGAERIATMLAITIENELSLEQYFSVPSDKILYFVDNQQPFGDDVACKFPSTTFDAGEACKCYALNRSTACVSHLMRVLEIGLQVFASRFNVPSDHTNWHNIIEGVEKAVRNMGADPNRQADWKDQQEFFAQAASSFMLIKNAWRNYTAHARGKYTEEEAETILINVRALMQKLATRLHE